MPRYSTLDVNEAIRLYNEEELNLNEIAKRLHADHSTIKKRLIEAGVEIKSQGRGSTRRKKQISKEELYDLYVNQKLGTDIIGKIYGCSDCTISKRLNEYNIPTRDIYEANKLKYKGVNTISAKGYRVISGYYDDGSYYRKGEHIITMENHLGRKLKPNEVVHHIDENTLNNDISNLQLMDKMDHDMYHRMKRQAYRLDWVVNFYLKNKRPPKKKEFTEFHYTSFYEDWGGSKQAWSEFERITGQEVDLNRTYTNEYMLSSIHEFEIKHGSRPSAKEMPIIFGFSYNTFINRFGGSKEAWQAYEEYKNNK